LNARRSSRSWAFIAVGGLLAAGCAGPHEPLQVGVGQTESNIILGDQQKQLNLPPVPIPPNALPLGPTTIPTVNGPEPAVAPFSAPPLPCPAANRESAPAQVALGDVALPPAPATYAFRNVGKFATSGATPIQGRFPTEATRTVRNVVDNGDGTFSYDVRSVLGLTATTTTYKLQPANDASGGIWIQKVRTQEYPDGSDPMDPKAKPKNDTTFDPTPDLQLIAFPVVGGASVTSRGIDTSTGTVMGLRSTVQVKDRTDACGTLIDTQVVNVDGEIGTCPTPPDGTIPTPSPTPAACDLGQITPNGERDTFEGQYRFATAYGGLIVQDSMDVLTETPTGNVSRQNSAIIDKVPLAAAKPRTH
jgi:hypothetical protein